VQKTYLKNINNYTFNILSKLNYLFSVLYKKTIFNKLVILLKTPNSMIKHLHFIFFLIYNLNYDYFNYNNYNYFLLI